MIVDKPVSGETAPSFGYVSRRSRIRAAGLVLGGLACIGVAGCASQVGLSSTSDQAPARSVDAKSPAPSPGLVYAEKACASCHAVRPGEPKSPDSHAPTFEVIANTPGITPMALNVWLHSSPHNEMPLVRVEPEQLEALSEYLATFKK